MKKTYTWKNPSREYFVKTFGGKAKRNKKVADYFKAGRSQVWIAQKMGITRQRVHQIIKAEFPS